MTTAPVVALAGNPNSGKSTLFNRLTGLRQKVANYPGITVEKKWAHARLAGRDLELVDLPGSYSLVSRSREEAIAFEVLTGRADRTPDLTVLVVDASNLSRNLYFALQVLELGRPALIALNMMDRAEGVGLALDAEVLARGLGVPVLPIVAATGEGVEGLGAAISAALDDPPRPPERAWRLSEEQEASIAKLAARLEGGANGVGAEALWLLTSLAAVDPTDEDADPLAGAPDLERLRTEAQAELADGRGERLLGDVIEARYRVADELSSEAVQGTRREDEPGRGVDRFLLHPLLGPLAFLLVMALLFQSIFAWSDPLIGLIEDVFGAVGDALGAALPEGAIRDLIVEGVVAGVGAVLVFVPQIAILFFFLALLEDSGYLARAAYMMDRVMARVGLHGRAFVPLMSGFACAIPAVMAARTIESTKDRLITILVIPLVSCSARLPVYALVITALFAHEEKVFGFISVGAALLLTMYLMSITVTLLVAFVLKRTLLKSPTPPLVLELPPYRRPHLKDAAVRAFDRCKVFVRDAGSVILACSIVLWALLSYPKMDAPAPGATPAAKEAATAAALEHSFAGRLGKLIEPAIEPLGFDWKIGIGLVGSFAAREVLVSTLGLVYGIGQDVDEESVPLREAMRKERNPETGAKVYTPLVGFSLMVFFLLACQCLSTVAVVRRETASWRWPLFMMAYMTTLAYLGSLIVYQGGRLLGFA